MANHLPFTGVIMKKFKFLAFFLSAFLILGCEQGTTTPPSDENLVSWMDAPSLKEAYAGKIGPVD